MNQPTDNKLEDILHIELKDAGTQVLKLIDVNKALTALRKREERLKIQAKIDELYWLNRMYRNRRDKSLIGMDLNELRDIDKDLNEIKDRIKALTSKEPNHE